MKSKRIVWIDILKTIAILAVIAIHVMGNTLNTYFISGTPNTVYNILIEIFSFAVPLFVMLSGILFLNKEKKITLKEMLQKYCLKIILVILVFGSFFIILEELFTYKTIGFDIFGKIFIRLINNFIWAHMWYLYLILGLYLLTPFIKNFINHTEKKDLKFLLIISFFFLLVVPELNNLFKLTIPTILPLTSAYLFYYVYAHYIKENPPKFLYKLISHILSILAIISIILKYTRNLTIFNPPYESLITFLITNSVLLLFLNKNISFKRDKIFSNFGENILGIYVLHQFFINIIFKFLKINYIITYPYLGLIVYILVIFIVTYITVYLLRKIKIMHKIL